jgi:hypothetical protein
MPLARRARRCPCLRTCCDLGSPFPGAAGGAPDFRGFCLPCERGVPFSLRVSRASVCARGLPVGVCHMWVCERSGVNKENGFPDTRGVVQPHRPTASSMRRRRPRLRAFVEPKLMHGVCGVHGHAHIELLNFSSWQEDCSQKTHGGEPICYLVDKDPGNDAEPWQELEAVLFERWLASPSNCNQGGRLRVDGCRIASDIVVVPSALAHCRSATGLRLYTSWNPAMVDGRSDVHEQYWDALRRYDASIIAARRERARGGGSSASTGSLRLPRYLIQYDGTWQMPYGLAMLQTLHHQPAEFVRRLMIASIESPLQLDVHARQFREPSSSPVFLSVPFSILTRSVVNSAKEVGPRPISVLFTGRVDSAFDGSRAAVHRLITKASEGRCRSGRDGRVSCTVCARRDAYTSAVADASRRGGVSACDLAFDRLHLQAYEDPSVFGALKVLSLASSATFCVEPTSDTLVRSHFYAAVLMGCIPVLFDTHLKFYPELPTYQTEWAWRQGVPRTPSIGGLGPLGAAAQKLSNHSRFAIIESVPALMGGDYDLMQRLVRLAEEPSEQPRLRRMQQALAEVAPLMTYAPVATATSMAINHSPGHGSAGAGAVCSAAGRGVAAAGAHAGALAPCDAFSMLALYAKGFVSQ